ncbi:MAG: helix-turn-helix domain-containing protein [candidate division WOR-3 bacterium]|nr:helix-turn-helix domain-containing protein [candidate division WOR-3 bacterium]
MKFYLTNEEKEKIRKLGILKTSQVAYFLGVSQKTIQRLIKEGYLKAAIFKKTFLVDAEELIRFVDSFKNMMSPFVLK